MEQLNIKIVGVGEGGAKAINKIMAAKIDKAIEFIAIGNDENIMLTSAAQKNIFLNRDLTTVYKNVFDTLNGADLIFIVGGLAGNASRISIPIITSFAKTYNAVTVAFFCKPSILETSSRKINSDYTLANLRGNVDTLFVIPAEKFFIFCIDRPQISLPEMFDVADDIFCRGVKIFLEMSDMSLEFFKRGDAAFGCGEATTALDAIKLAASFPTLEEDELKTAQKIFVRLASGSPLPMTSLDAAKKFIKAQLQPDTEFLSREEINPLLGEKIFASIVCTRREKK